MNTKTAAKLTRRVVLAAGAVVFIICARHAATAQDQPGDGVPPPPGWVQTDCNWWHTDPMPCYEPPKDGAL